MHDFGLGSIGGIIIGLQNRHNVANVKELSTTVKLNALCESLQLSHIQFDRTIASHPEVLRTVKGHAFESVLDRICSAAGIELLAVGGDGPIDRTLNGITLQLKTPYAAGTSDGIVEYKSHKTHGAKSESESMEYYHSVDEFADYLIGLVSYEPLRIVVLPKAQIPRHPLDNDRILSPFRIQLEGNEHLNAFDLIGAGAIAECAELFVAQPDELLPLTSHILNLNSDIILNTILDVDNFRIWGMSIRGFAKEIVFKDFLNASRIAHFPPGQLRNDGRANKSDIALRHLVTQQPTFLQVKGVSTSNCKFNGENSIVGIETQLTRGRVNDHPTQSRLYLATDFDFVLIGLDPLVVWAFHDEVGRPRVLEWEFFAVPTNLLSRHHVFGNRLSSVQRFRYVDLAPYSVTPRWIRQWERI